MHLSFACSQVEYRTGTLLFIRVSELDQLTAVRSPQALARLQDVADVFTRVVVGAAKENKGIVRNLAHDRCLISWNLMPQCHMHVPKAITMVASSPAVRVTPKRSTPDVEDGMRSQYNAGRLQEATSLFCS